MNSTEGDLVPENSPTTTARRPSKPVQTPVPLERLLEHYHAQLPAYLARVDLEASPHLAMAPFDPSDPPSKERVIDLIRRQNAKLGRFIRRRSVELLQTVVETNADGRTVGHSYDDILAILRVEYPECSTSAAALRWYVVHLWSEADEEGLPRPKMPQIRPRSVKRREAGA